MTQTKWEPFVTVRAVQPVIAGLDTLGYETDRILTKSNISRTALENVDGRIPHATMMALWQEALAVTNDENLGIHLAEAAPLESFGVHAYALQSSPTLRQAYRRACRYQRLIHEVTDLTFDEKESEGVLHHALPGGRSVPRHPAEFLVTLWIRFGRLIPGNKWSPDLVCFAHDKPPDITEHKRVFQAPLQFLSGRTAMHIPNTVLDIPNTKADIGLIGVLDDYAERLLDQMPTGNTLSDRVRFQLLEELKGGTPTAEEIAKTLHISARTLHRNLQKEDTTFSELLDQLRQEQAVSYLTNPQISISEVAFLLGFSEISSFYRAFKRWTGTTPADFRAKNPSLSLHS